MSLREYAEAASDLFEGHGFATPPKPPWRPLVGNGAMEGYLSYFYADDLSGLPVRAVTKIGDNKSDPNIETGTYGLFSTCSHAMRASIVKHGVPNIFFVTRYKGERVIAGYYEVGWFAAGPAPKKQADYALACRRCHFVVPPVRAVDLPAGLREQFVARWRTTKRLNEGPTSRLRAILETRRDSTARYVQEIRRLEAFNRFHSGFAYVTWRRRDGFSWTDAREYLQAAKTVTRTTPTNSSESNRWSCSSCKRMTQNKALLKRCPWCGEFATLQPI